MRTDQQELLSKPFEAHEHGFKNGNCYIRKSAIRRRLSLVDPHWKLTEPEFICVDGDVVIMRGGLTVCGITRYQIGSGIIQRKSEGKTNKEGKYEEGKPLEGYALASQVAKAYKSAATDILARAAVEFNIGAYLKDAAKEDRPSNQASLTALLAKLSPVQIDPNVWTPDNIRAWGDKWRAAGLTDDQLMKALNIGERWMNFKGTVADADKAVEAYRTLQSSFATAQPAAATPLPSIDTRIICPITLIQEGDVILQETKSQTQGTIRTFLEVIKYSGKIGSQYSLVLKNLATGVTKSVFWSGGDQTLVDGPKVKRYLEDPSVCRKTNGYPVWLGEGEPVRV